MGNIRRGIQRGAIGARPAANPQAEAWIRRGDGVGANGSTTDFIKGDLFTARLTLDVTPALRGRIKVEAFTRGITVAEMLREVLEREFPEVSS